MANNDFEELRKVFKQALYDDCTTALSYALAFMTFIVYQYVLYRTLFTFTKLPALVDSMEKWYETETILNELLIQQVRMELER